MYSGRYSIEVNEESVEICGRLSIEETFDFLNFFEKKGFHCVQTICDSEGIIMTRDTLETIDEIEEKIKEKEHIESEKFYETLYDQSKEHIKKLEKQIIDLERLIKDLMTEEKTKQAQIQRQYDSLLKSQRILDLNKNTVVKNILENIQESFEIEEENLKNEDDV